MKVPMGMAGFWSNLFIAGLCLFVRLEAKVEVGKIRANLFFVSRPSHFSGDQDHDSDDPFLPRGDLMVRCRPIRYTPWQ